jgi:hypothetical protein
MVTVSEIPLSPTPQRFNAALAGVVYQFTLYWVEKVAQSWQIDISDSAGTLLIAGVPLLPGADILAQHKWLNFPGELWVLCDYNEQAAPLFTDLGINSHLYFIVR